MYARSNTIMGNPQAMDEGITYVRDEVLPLLSGMDGFVGLSMLCERDTGRCIVTSAWESQDAMRASDAGVQASRARAAEIFGGATPEVREWEIALMHRKRDAPDGACCRVTWSRGEADRIDSMVDTFRMGIMPRVDELAGFCSVSLLVDRATGMCTLAATYESREALQATSQDVDTLREQFTRETGFQVTDMAEMELALAQLHVPETV